MFLWIIPVFVFIAMCSFGRLKSLTLLKGEKYVISQNIFCHSWLGFSEPTAQPVRRHLLLMLKLGLLAELLLLFVNGAIGSPFTTPWLLQSLPPALSEGRSWD